MKITLLLTGTIVPSYKNHIKRINPEIRIQDYINAINRWLKDPSINSIVFCENSGYGTDKIENAIKNRFHKEIEFLSYTDNPNFNFSYGYSELGIIDYIIDNSKILKYCDSFIKSTGRLYFPKTKKILKCLNDNNMFWVDARQNFLFWKNEQITTQLMIFSKSFYKTTFYKKRSQMHQGECIEKFFYRKLISYNKKEGCHFRWHSNVDPIGKGAHNDQSYRSINKTIQYIIRGICRKLLPNLWI